jgi:hypothetical protein
MFRRVLVSLCLMALPVAGAAAAQRVDAGPQHPTVSAQSVTTSLPAPTPRVPLAELLGLAAIVGATAPKKQRTANLARAYTFNGVTYGPGRDVSVPDDFPELDDNGDVNFPEGSRAAQNQARARSFASPPNTGGVNTGEGQAGSTLTVSGKSREELESMTKDELAALAGEKGITVVREDGEEGTPLKSDYVTQLSKSQASA